LPASDTTGFSSRRHAFQDALLDGKLMSMRGTTPILLPRDAVASRADFIPEKLQD
jgi:hypothetical protein